MHSSNFVVYEAISPSGKRYIGKTANLERRIAEHFANMNYLITSFKCALKKYGRDITFKVLVETDCEEMAFIMERHYIQFYKTMNRDFGYNMTEGGQGTEGAIRTQKQKDSISVKAKARMALKGNPFKGKKHTEQTKAILRSKKLGKPRLGGGTPPIRVRDELGNEFESMSAAARFYGTTVSSIFDNTSGRTKTCKGHVFIKLKENNNE